ncbi:acyl-CoA dehydrogenase family protein [Allobranchiibius sp. GilTou73]|uniref:acyl-CoA dehydrogenase family protein n=1 Tax=Allobranchiibius sp. GilTou73 TaxID=2904523 RepID=UPI001F322A68|nr:acyl-CoA dehydrogenase family protein [Allobranchiibius sp. GilTou73]UIJ34013.1 acyl-CoA dehydrogenase family protein [Allobranchiibius sp. GilTou73]
MDLSLNEDQRDLRDLVREFLEKEVVPHRAQWDRDESVDTSIVPRLGELGVFGFGIPEEYGGVQADFFTYVLVMEELGRADSAIRGIVSVSNGLVAKTIAAHGTTEQKQQWLPGLATGRQLGCFGLTEPGNGSDAGNLTTKARRDGSDYVLQGEKIFITNGTWADVAPRLRADQ